MERLPICPPQVVSTGFFCWLMGKPLNNPSSGEELCQSSTRAAGTVQTRYRWPGTRCNWRSGRGFWSVEVWHCLPLVMIFHTGLNKKGGDEWSVVKLLLTKTLSCFFSCPSRSRISDLIRTFPQPWGYTEPGTTASRISGFTCFPKHGVNSSKKFDDRTAGSCYHLATNLHQYKNGFWRLFSPQLRAFKTFTTWAFQVINKVSKVEQVTTKNWAIWNGK